MSQVKGLRLGRLEDATDRRVELRTAIVRVRFTPVEKGRLHEITREMGLSLADYIRRVVLDRPLPSRRAIRPIPEVNQDLYVELRRIGVNLNQLAQRMNRAESPDRREILPVIEMLAGAIADIQMKVIGAGSSKEPPVGEPR
jgi:hypothetical protein